MIRIRQTFDRHGLLLRCTRIRVELVRKGAVATTPDVLEVSLTAQQKELIQAQLQNLLASPVFRNSQRYPALLRYVIEETLAGNADQLKERTLGITVFHRAPDYDTSADPVVRVTAGEVRKRLAQYYQDHASELRIDLPAGSYVPYFHLGSQVEQAPPLAAEAALPVAVEATPPERLERNYRRVLLLAGLVLCLIVTGALLLHRSRSEAALHDFWAPVTTTPAEPGFILGGRWAVYLTADPSAAPGPNAQAHSTDPAERVNTISVGDALSFARVASFLSRRGHRYTAASSAQTSLEDLRAHPSVLFGAFNNSWTLRATDTLRFRLRFSDQPQKDRIGWIEDTTNPARQWSVHWDQPMLSMTRDYAIVARYFDPETEQEVVLAAGLGENGTTAASEFLTNGHYLAQLDHFAPGGKWAKRNVEAVLETEVVGGRSGPPKVIAANFW